jgi:hypothetical protein
MKKTWIPVLAVLGLLAVGATLAAPLAYSLDWWTTDNGGGDSQSGTYSLSATIGQPDAGLLTGGEYTIAGGFWGGVWQPVIRIYLPIVVR